MDRSKPVVYRDMPLFGGHFPRYYVIYQTYSEKYRIRGPVPVRHNIIRDKEVIFKIRRILSHEKVHAQLRPAYLYYQNGLWDDTKLSVYMKDGYMVTLSVKMRVRGAGSRREAVWSATEHFEDAIRNSVEVTYSADAKRISQFDEEPVFGKNWE